MTELTEVVPKRVGAGGAVARAAQEKLEAGNYYEALQIYHAQAARCVVRFPEP